MNLVQPETPVSSPNASLAPLHRTGQGKPESQSPSAAGKIGSKAKTTVRLLLADDHPIVRRGIGSCLARHPSFQVVGEASDGQEAVRKAKELLPDIVLMDIDMPVMNGLAATEILRKELPQTRVLILSMLSNADAVVRIIRAGARGYVLKEAPTEELIKAIEAVNAGQPFFSSDVARSALNQFVRGSGKDDPASLLTNREREVLTHIAEGLSNKEIASLLGVGVRTVETHRERIMRKLNIHTIAGLTRFAVATGLVSIGETSGAGTRPGQI